MSRTSFRAFRFAATALIAALPVLLPGVAHAQNAPDIQEVIDAFHQLQQQLHEKMLDEQRRLAGQKIDLAPKHASEPLEFVPSGDDRALAPHLRHVSAARELLGQKLGPAHTVSCDRFMAQVFATAAPSLLSRVAQVAGRGCPGADEWARSLEKAHGFTLVRVVPQVRAGDVLAVRSVGRHPAIAAIVEASPLPLPETADGTTAWHVPVIGPQNGKVERIWLRVSVQADGTLIHQVQPDRKQPVQPLFIGRLPPPLILPRPGAPERAPGR